MPVYNEESTAAAVLNRLLGLDFQKEIIVVDDGSSDNTRSLLAKISHADVRIICHPTNAGKGAAIRTGLALATGDIVVIQDADLELRPEELPRLLEPIERGEALVVYGSRFMHRPARVNWLNYGANRALTALTNLLYGSSLTDMETCYKMIRKDLLDELTIESDCFAFEPEITAKLLKNKVKIMEIPVFYEFRTKEQGKKMRIKDGFTAVRTLFRYW